MAAQFARCRSGAPIACLSIAMAACGGGGRSAGPTAPVVPPNGPCVAATSFSRGLFPIINGTACDVENSSVVLLEFRSTSGASMGRCSGTVIGSHAVLTAAHCVSGNPAQAIIRGGAPEIIARSFWAHPDYRPGPFPLDVAVIRTAEPVGRPPVLLLVSRAARIGETGVMAGWGVDQSGAGSVLRAGVATVDFVGDTYLTTRFTEGVSATCSGDSGGPILLSPGGADWALAGVASTGVFDPRTNAPVCQNGISVFTSVGANGVPAFITALVPDATLR